MNRPKPLLPLLAMLLISMIFIAGCRKDGGGSHCDGVKQPEERLSAGDFWILKHSVGETLHFNEYKKIKTQLGDRYEYQRDVSFIAADTATVKIMEEFYGGVSECYGNEKPYYHYKLNFSGPYKLETYIRPNVFGADLRIVFADRYFQISSHVLSRNWGESWFERYNIGDSTFRNVVTSKGYISWMSTEGYIDSTYAFYNLDHGLLKFIINDTLILERRF